MDRWIRCWVFVVAWFVVAWLGPIGASLALPPADVGYQGKLLDAAGAPLPGPVNIELAIWDALSDGARLYREVHLDQPLTGGVFDVLIGAGDFREGSFDSTLFESANRYLEVTIAGETLAPRQPFTSVAYALQSGDAATVGLILPTEIVTNSTIDAVFSTNVSVIAESQVPDTIARDTEVLVLQDQITTLQNQLAALQSVVDTLDLTALESAVEALTTRFAGVERSGDTLRFSGMNVQILNGEGSTETTNGLGNLVVGYNEDAATAQERTGSHNLVVGNEHGFSSYGGLVAGQRNTISEAFASVSGGRDNTASGPWSSVSGGLNNTASGSRSSVSAGNGNTASGPFSSVSGGSGNTASGSTSSVSGGRNNTAGIGAWTSVSGGFERTSGGQYDWRGGGLSQDQ
ncbi:MAG: hypothetical protein QNK03_17520 [Myxococcota bacterium]|nr:hypothetical protein [Myxococcota bacterium]